MADRHHATSGGPAVSLDVARTGLKADKHVAALKEEEEVKVGVKHKREEGDRVPCKKKPRQYPAHAYKKRRDGWPPEMSQIHVDFARIKADFLRTRPDAVQKEFIIANFNSSEDAERGYAPGVARGSTRSGICGKASHFFNNAYFTAQDLRMVALGFPRRRGGTDNGRRRRERARACGHAGMRAAQVGASRTCGGRFAVDGQRSRRSQLVEGERRRRRERPCASRRGGRGSGGVAGGRRRAPLRGGRGRSPICGGSCLAGGR
jgi:hypothetical protein